MIRAFSRFWAIGRAETRVLHFSERGLDPDGSSGLPSVVRRALEYIERHYESPLSLSGIAREIGISPNYLSRLFRQHTGTTLTSHVQKVRVAHARTLLAQGEYSISEIAFRTGYRTYRDFYRNFIKYEQIAPGTFAKRSRGH